MLQDCFRDRVECRFGMAWISYDPTGPLVPKITFAKGWRGLTEERLEDLCGFLSFSRETESLDKISRLVRDLVATFLYKRRSLDSRLLCGQSKLVEHGYRPQSSRSSLIVGSWWWIVKRMCKFHSSSRLGA